jgi:LPXTG-motif cell wall-anchored protein
MSNGQPVDGGVSRRDALKRGLLVGGALWAVPVVQVVTMTEAHAETASGPAFQQQEDEAAKVGRGLLPKTGSGLSPALVAAVGAGLVAAGSATVVAQRRRAAAQVAGGPATDDPLAFIEPDQAAEAPQPTDPADPAGPKHARRP